MEIITEKKRAGSYIVREIDGLSRDLVTVLSGQNLPTARVVGNSFAAVAAPSGANTGDGAAGAVTIGDHAEEGVYALTCVSAAANAGVFTVSMPGGGMLHDLTVGVEYLSPHINLTLADGAVDFVVGDVITITLSVAGVIGCDPDAVDGSQKAAGVLYDGVDATAAAKTGVITARLSSVRVSDLVWADNATPADILSGMASLADAGIFAR